MKYIRLSLFFWLIIFFFIACKKEQKNTTQNDPFDKQYNVLWLVAEDMSPNIPPFGDSTIQTPNLSRLAAEGVSIHQYLFHLGSMCAEPGGSLHGDVSIEYWCPPYADDFADGQCKKIFRVDQL